MSQTRRYFSSRTTTQPFKVEIKDVKVVTVSIFFFYVKEENICDLEESRTRLGEDSVG